jgi:hypothetical protein
MSLAGPHPPRGLFGDLLWGNKVMRFVYMDEAGTSEREPVTVVVALIVNADEQLMFAEAAVSEVLGAVPEHFRKGFVFHATDVWNDEKYRQSWMMSDRLALLHAMMALPRRLKIPITLSIIRRNSPPVDKMMNLGLSLAQSQHVQAFISCVAHADRFIRHHADLREVGSVVAEDVPEMRKFLKLAPKVARQMPMTLPSIILTEAEKAQGYTTQQTDIRVTRIRNSVHFVGKGDDPILQLADACAFGFRRLFSEQEFGKDFGRSIVGYDISLKDYAGGASLATF